MLATARPRGHHRRISPRLPVPDVPRATAEPVIVLGMHRSGTSMLATLLADAGLFLGHKVQPGHQEAEFFQHLNMYVLAESSADWDRPAGVATMLADDRARRYLVDYLAMSVNSPRAISFLGSRRYLRHRSLGTLEIPWGWKDPRTTLTFPLWLDVFPRAKVIHVTRHGVDVAHSLQVRYDKSIDAYVDRYRHRKGLYRFIARRHHLTTGLRVASLDDGLDLWDDYVRAAHAAVTSLGDRAIEFRYEDFLEDPDPVMHRLLDFCNVAVAPDRSWTEQVQSTRAFAYRQDPELVAVAERHGERLAGHGYSV